MMNIVNSNFDKQKSQCLAKNDFSRKGSIDEPIRNLIDKINSSLDYFTTSSCSGRLALINQNASSVCDKRLCKFFMNAHDRIDFENFKTVLLDADRDDQLLLKFEPFILHVQCRSLASAKNLHILSTECGFRNSGLTLGKNGKVTLAVRCTLGLEVPLGKNNGAMLDDNYFRFLIDIVNEKFSTNEKMTEHFENQFSDMLIADTK